MEKPTTNNMDESATMQLVVLINSLNVEVEVKAKLMTLISKTITEIYLNAELISKEQN